MNNKRNSVPRWIWVLLGIVVMAIIITPLAFKKTEREKLAEFEEFVLKVGEEIPTVEVGPGTYHCLWANKPYQAVSIQLDGSREIYNMPAGRESWIGAAPPGRLRLIGKQEGTIVKIWSQ